MATTPIVKKPKLLAAYPPANHLRPYRVRNGDNWWTLQKAFGLRDPWDLIRFNFKTNDPAEVNWYLREYLGCTKTTPDGKNYCFSNNLKPGLLYLPRISAKRSMGMGSGGASDDNTSSATDDKAVRDNVRWAFSQNRAIQAINFELAGQVVSPNDYWRVQRLIKEGEIFVGHDPSIGGNAYYQPEVDTLYLGDGKIAPEEVAFLVIHESTHAAFDARGLPISDLLSEAVAYVASMMYEITRNKGYKPGQGHGTIKEDVRIYLPAFRIAKLLLKKNNDPDDFEFEDSKKIVSDLMGLYQALLGHSQYKKQFLKASEMYEGKAPFNGIKGWVYYGWNERKRSHRR